MLKSIVLPAAAPETMLSSEVMGSLNASGGAGRLHGEPSAMGQRAYVLESSLGRCCPLHNVGGHILRDQW